MNKNILDEMVRLSGITPNKQNISEDISISDLNKDHFEKSRNDIEYFLRNAVSSRRFGQAINSLDGKYLNLFNDVRMILRDMVKQAKNNISRFDDKEAIKIEQDRIKTMSDILEELEKSRQDISKMSSKMSKKIMSLSNKK